MDWLGTLKEKGDFAKRIAAQTVEALKHPNLTIDQGIGFISWWLRVAKNLTNLSKS